MSTDVATESKSDSKTEMAVDSTTASPPTGSEEDKKSAVGQGQTLAKSRKKTHTDTILS